LIVLPKRIEKRLKEEAEKTGVLEEELILEALLKALNEPLDPETKVEIHLKLSEKYMKDAEELLTKKDYIQASEKAWSAAAQIVKALPQKKEKSLGVTLIFGSLLMKLLRSFKTLNLDACGVELTHFIKTSTKIGCLQEMSYML
jgi:hypothetical protein